jgi:hypothetical protein
MIVVVLIRVLLVALMPATLAVRLVVTHVEQIAQQREILVVRRVAIPVGQVVPERVILAIFVAEPILSRLPVIIHRIVSVILALLDVLRQLTLAILPVETLVAIAALLLAIPVFAIRVSQAVLRL